MTKVSSTYPSHRQGMGRAKAFDFKLFHEQVGKEGTNGGSHSSSMDLLVIFILEGEVCVSEAKLLEYDYLL